MLDTMRKHSRSFIIYIFFGIIIAVFVINFGPQSGGCVARSTQAGHIEGNAVSINDVGYALAVAGINAQAQNDEQMEYIRALVMDRYIVRELFAERARDLGLRISDREIDDMLLSGKYLALGDPRPLIRGENNRFDYDLFSRYVRYNWGTSVRKFKDEQRRELLAEKLRTLMRTSITVSEEEARADFVQRNTQIKLRYVALPASAFLESVPLDKAQVDRYVAAHGAEIKSRYEGNRAAFTDLPRQLELRVISVSFAKAGGKEAAQRKAAAAVKELNGGKDFAAVARTTSDAPSGSAGGLIGWRNADKTGLGSEVDVVVAALKPGQISAPVLAGDRYLVIKIDNQREGTLTLDQAKAEIAFDMLRDEQSLSLARKEADRLLAELKGGKAMDQLFRPAKTENGENGESASAADPASPAAEADKVWPTPFELQETSLFSRTANDLVPGIGASRELTQEVFRLKQGAVVPQPFVVGKTAYIVSVAERHDPDFTEWATTKVNLMQSYTDKMWVELVRETERRLCDDALAQKRISISSDILLPPPVQGAQPSTNKPAPTYIPCKTLQLSSM